MLFKLIHKKPEKNENETKIPQVWKSFQFAVLALQLLFVFASSWFSLSFRALLTKLSREKSSEAVDINFHLVSSENPAHTVFLCAQWVFELCGKLIFSSTFFIYLKNGFPSRISEKVSVSVEKSAPFKSQLNNFLELNQEKGPSST